MDLIALAVPFFLLALLLELAVDRWRGTGYYRANDAINSLSAGTLSTTIGYFTRYAPVYISGFAFQHYAIFDIDAAWFDLSARGLLLWICAILAWDFCYYWAHRCGHEISILWAAHAVHHQSEDYNLSTALRQTSTGFLFNWVFYLPLFLIGLPIEVVATANAIDLIYQFWVHTRHVGRLGWLDYVFVTPSNHRVHHAQNEVYIDRNYGGILILWDRLFGSFQPELDEEPVVFGVRKPLASWNPFWANWQVYDYLLFDARRTRRWRDKLKVWFGRTGWRPDDVARRYPKRNADIATFRRYDPAVSSSVKRYAIAQFAVAAIGVLGIGVLYAQQGLAAVVVPCVALWALLFALGRLLEGRADALRIETLRLIIVMPLLVFAWLLQPSPSPSPVLLAAAATIYVGVSLLALIASRRNRPQPAREGTAVGP
ncbi:MAG: sterol desaturase family protein [Woeseiaceae bacterium]|nr:sterol desaturase family protein [Woeseiaceae bacterium]